MKSPFPRSCTQPEYRQNTVPPPGKRISVKLHYHDSWIRFSSSTLARRLLRLSIKKLDLQKKRKRPDGESCGKRWFSTFCWSCGRQEATDLRSVWKLHQQLCSPLEPRLRPARGERRERRSRSLAASQPDPVSLITVPECCSLIWK